MRNHVMAGLILLALSNGGSPAWADASPKGKTYVVEYVVFRIVPEIREVQVTRYRQETRTRTVPVVVDGQVVYRTESYTVTFPYTETQELTVMSLAPESVLGTWEFRRNLRLFGPPNSPLTYFSTSGWLLSSWQAIDAADPMGLKIYSGVTYFQNGATLKGKMILLSPEFGVRVGDVKGQLVE